MFEKNGFFICESVDERSKLMAQPETNAIFLIKQYFKSELDVIWIHDGKRVFLGSMSAEYLRGQSAKEIVDTKVFGFFEQHHLSKNKEFPPICISSDLRVFLN